MRLKFLKSVISANLSPKTLSPVAVTHIHFEKSSFTVCKVDLQSSKTSAILYSPIIEIFWQLKEIIFGLILTVIYS